MSPAPKTPRKKTAKKAPAKRKTAAPRKKATSRKPVSKGGGRRPPSKRTTAKRKTTRKRAGASGGGRFARFSVVLGGLALLALAGLTFSWPDFGETPQRSAEPAVTESRSVEVAKQEPARQTTPPKAETKAKAPAKPSEEPKAPVEQAAPPPEPAKVQPEKTVEELAVAPPKPVAEPVWKRYAATHKAKPGQPMIAIVLDDLGPNKQRTRNATDLPGPLTLAFLPYAKDLPAQTARARQRGHELLIHMPMEPKDLAGNNPGENALLTSLSDAEIKRRLEWALDRFPAYVGMNNHMGSAFTANRQKMDLVMDRLADRGALFLDSVTNGRTQGAKAARAAGIPSVSRDIFLDHHGDDPGLVLKQLAKVEAVAKKQGYAIAIGHPHDGTVTALELWIPDALARGFALVPVSALVEDPTPPGLRG